MYSSQPDYRWRPFFEAIQRKLGQQAFETWFRPLRIAGSTTDRVLRITAPNHVVQDWILSQYSAVFDDSLLESHLDDYRIEWEQLPGCDAAIRTDSGILRKPDLEPIDGFSSCISSADDCCLNKSYSFENFVVAACNRLAHAAAKAVAEAPGRTYNPLYLYGGVGLGKTHLVQAIGHAIRDIHPALRVAYLSLERFMNEMIAAIRYGSDKTGAFRERYRRIDVLVIDDVQFIAGKERTQEEFFHTFNALYDNQKQIVITSDCPPKAIPEIEERLHSRFEWGLIADIEPPDLETKVAIVKHKSASHQIDMPDDVALCLAKSSKHNIRELEGSLIRLIAMASLRGLPLTVGLAEDSLRVINQTVGQSVTIEKIQSCVAEHFKTDPESLKARSSVRPILFPRQVGMYLCKRLTKQSYPEIARHFGGRHHTTVIHSVDKIEKSIRSDRELEATISKLIEKITA